MARSKRHVHKYHKVMVANQYVWACALPDCTHYMPKHMENMIPGKYSICWNCGETFLLDTVNMRTDKPYCPDCMVPSDTHDIMESFASGHKS